MKDLNDLLQKTEELSTYLRQKGMEFYTDGYPIFKREMFLDEKPAQLIPIQHKKSRLIKDPKSTVLVFFCADKYIYPRVDRLFDEIEDYKRYMAVAGFDITVTADMDIEWQRVIMLLNLLATAVLAINGIKIVMNTRIGSRQTLEVLMRMPRGVIAVSGFRGGRQKNVAFENEYLSKILSLLPKCQLIYGSCSKTVLEQLDRMGIDYEVYPDFRELCREVK